MNENKPLKIELIQTDKAFSALKTEWENLENHVKDLTVFQTWIFQYNTWKIFSEQVHLNILAFYNNENQLVGCAPLGWQKHYIGPIPVKQLGFACIKYCDFQNLVIHKDYRKAVMDQFSQWLYDNRSQWDDIELRFVRKDFVLYKNRDFLKALFGSSMKVTEEGVAPYITIQEDWNDFQSTLSSKRAKSMRYEIRNLFRQFEGGEYVHYTKGDGLLNALDRFMDLHQRRIRQKYQLGAFPSKAVREGFSNLVQELEKYDYVDIHTIESKEKTIAAIGTFIHNDVISYFQGGFDPEYYKVSPGKVILAMRITEAIQKKKQEFDFLVGDEDYKFAWSTAQREIYKLNFKSGSWKQGLFKMLNRLRERLQQSERFRSLYFTLTGK